MHGRKKTSTVASDAEVAAIQRKAESLSETVQKFFELKKKGDKTDTTLEFTSKLLRINPDFYSVWNYRKEILIFNNASLSVTAEHKSQLIVDNDLREKELKLSEDCIKKSPKSCKHKIVRIVHIAFGYNSTHSTFETHSPDGAWHHRQWILERIETNYASELELCRLLLTEDQRNFHCWCYRRFVAQTGGILSQDEFNYSTEKIDENFSNYSAFHHRSVYIQRIGIAARDIVESEFEIIENAIYTEPDDQSSWWYHQFLLKWMAQAQLNIEISDNAKSKDLKAYDDHKWFLSVLENQMNVMRGLLSVEVSSKWAMTSLCMMLEILLKAMCVNPQALPAGHSFMTTDHHVKERQKLLGELCVVDPFHINRYKYLQSREVHLLTSTFR